MSNKKQLLTESEMRRFMALANIPSLNPVNETYSVGGMAGQEQELEEVYSEDGDMPQETPPEAPPAPEADAAGGDDTMELGDLGGAVGGLELSPEQSEQVLQAFAKALGIKVDISQEAGAGEASEAGGEMDMGSMEDMEDSESEEEEEESGEEESGESEEDEGEGEEEEEDSEEEMDETQDPAALQESLIQAVLARVTARLVSEARAAKAKGKKVLDKEGKKKSVRDRMADMRARAKKGGKKLDEANAPAPKSTNSNGPKKGAGSATKGKWGVSSNVPDQEWKKGKDGKGGHELETVSASAEHTVSHGKTNLATKGSKK